MIWMFLRLDQARPASRMFPSDVLKFSQVTGAGLAMVASAATATMSFLVYGPILLEVLYGVTPLAAGFIIALESIVWGLAAIVFSGHTKAAEKWLIRTGTALVSLGVFGFAVAMPSGYLWLVISCAVVQGAGFGMMWGYVVRHLITAARPAERDITSTAIPTTQQIGFAIVAAAAGIVANFAGFSDGVSQQSAEVVAFWVFAAFVPLAAFANVAAWQLLRERS
jgi:MFS family permease